MVRKIIKPTSENYNLHIPKEYLGKNVEILILPFDYDDKENYETWSEDELNQIGQIGFSSKSFVNDDEDYSKW